ncbi:unnamed protein product [Owenia fusiformis]|uniref:Uncharacterized protein n=1 Tax=Owenia fusiformis TaxID=6347 RepID=A0A8J1XYF3_OWEFU|nr:unnamed protein product [Owenia fusiformis]
MDGVGKDEKNSDEDKDSSLRDILGNFASSTTAHGCERIDKSTSTIARVIWATIFIGCTIAAIVCIAALLEKYFQYPSKDVYEMNSDKIEFPSISFCSLKPIVSSYKKRVAKMEPGNPYMEIDKAIKNIDGVLDYLSQENNTQNNLYQRLKEMYYLFASYTSMYIHATDETRSLGHQLEDLLLSCKVNMMSCVNMPDVKIKQFDNALYWNCYTFNWKDYNTTGESEPYVEMVGGLSGFQATFFLDNIDTLESYYNPMCPIDGSVGAKLIIHRPGSRPDPLREGLEVPVGFSTNVAVSKKKRELIGQPWGDCENREKLDGAPYRYDQANCERGCQQKEIVKKCGCVSPWLPVSDEQKNISWCGKFNLDNFNSASPNLTILDKDLIPFECHMMMTKMTPNVTECDCPPACENHMYEYKTSQSQWLLGGNRLNFYQSVVNRMGDSYINSSMYHLLDAALNSNDSAENFKNRNLVSQNFLRVNIFFDSMHTDLIRRVEEYTFTDMISGVGGGFGVYVGFSIVTMCEFVVLFASLVTALIQRYGLRQNKVAMESAPTHVHIIHVKHANNHLADVD